MPKYEFGKAWWLPELSRHAEPGEVVELSKERADELLHNEPGLLKPVRQTTQGKAPVVRNAPKTARTRVSRAKK